MRADGASLWSNEHPGHSAPAALPTRLAALLAGLPHALYLRDEEGGEAVLLPAIAKPCRLAPTGQPLAAQLLLARHAPGWAEALPGVRHYLYPLHRTGAYLAPPSLAARLYLLLLRWVNRDWAAAAELAAGCTADTDLSEEESQLWAMVGELDDDSEPAAHALRLRLSLAARCCPQLLAPWSVAEQLRLYIAKLPHVPAACALPAADELELLRPHVAQLPALAPRAALLAAALGAEAPIWHPCAYPPAPPRPQKHAPMTESGHAALLGPAAAAAWKGRLEKIQYQRPEDQQFGEVAAATVGGWLPNLKFDAEKSGFWLLYELLVGGLAVKVLAEDDTHELGALLARMSSTGGANELLPLLRALEMEPGLCSALPSFSGEKKKGVIGLFKKGMNAKGMSEQLLGALQKELPKLPRPPPRAAPNPYVPPTQLALPPMRQLRTAYRAWTAPGALGVGCDKRPMPAPYAADGSTVLSLAAAFLEKGKVAASSKGPELKLEGHPAARSVVAVKMLKRLRDDAQWLAQKDADGGGPPTLKGGAKADVASRLVAALAEAHAADAAALEPELRALLDAANGGGAEVSRGSAARARSRWRRGARRRWGCPTSRRC